MYFYPRPPRGGRLKQSVSDRDKQLFLSTPSARRATEVQRVHRGHAGNFYPRPPRGGRPGRLLLLPLSGRISIHALREEGDQQCYKAFWLFPHFYPRPPRGGRPAAFARFVICPLISIHALREEGDTLTVTEYIDGTQFLSTPSARRATCALLLLDRRTLHFYPRPPRGGRPAA